MPEKPFVLSVKVVILDNNGRCLLLKRSMSSKGNPGKWDFPGGKVDAGERFDQALIREVAEETGLTISLDRVLGATESELPAVKVVYLFMEGHLKSGQVQLSSEHDDFVWVERRELVTMDFAGQFNTIIKAYSIADDGKPLLKN